MLINGGLIAAQGIKPEDERYGWKAYLERLERERKYVLYET